MIPKTNNGAQNNIPIFSASQHKRNEEKIAIIKPKITNTYPDIITEFSQSGHLGVSELKLRLLSQFPSLVFSEHLGQKYV